MIFEIKDLDAKLKTWADLVSKLQCARFYEIWHSEQVTTLIIALTPR